MPSHTVRGVRQTLGRDLPSPCGGRDPFRQIAEVRPATREELAVIGGVGPAKLAAYAEAVLDLCRAGGG